MRASRNQGFSLLELMIVLAVMGVLSVLAIPSFVDWIQNGKSRTVAESIQNGLRYAQGEAARLSRLTTFTPTSRGWTVDYIANTVDPSADTTPHPLQRSPAGSLQGTVISPGAGTPAVLEFDGLGRVFRRSHERGAVFRAGCRRNIRRDQSERISQASRSGVAGGKGSDVRSRQVIFRFESGWVLK